MLIGLGCISVNFINIIDFYDYFIILAVLLRSCLNSDSISNNIELTFNRNQSINQFFNQ